MKERFEGESGGRVLIEALKTQKLVAGSVDIACSIAEIGELVDIIAGTAIIEQSTWTTDVYFILAGEFEIVVNGRRIAARVPNDHVGEMAAITTFLPRAARVVALADSVVCKLSEAQFSEIADRYPQIWRGVAKELAHRLMQRNNLVTKARTRSHVFIISSAEALGIARELEAAFMHDPFTVTVWTDGVFRASHYPVESLESELDRSDFAIAVVQPDDRTESRGQSAPSPRDNVVFELGFFMGRLGRHRTFLVEPIGHDETRLPSDLMGINTVKYKHVVSGDVAANVGPACTEIRKIVGELGPNN